MTDDERHAIQAEGCTAAELATMRLPEPRPYVRGLPAGADYLDVVTPLVRRFLGMPDDEPTEPTFLVRGKVQIAHALTIADHIRLLREAEQIPDFRGAYMLVNPINPDILARHESNIIVRYPEHRASDNDIAERRAVFIDVDPIRPKGISSTDAQHREAGEISARLEEWLASVIGRNAIGHGSSGNGYFSLIAIEPRPLHKEDRARISGFLKLLNKKFGTDRVKIDDSVFNAARLMPAPGTMKKKGADTPERPHRRTSFCCRPNVQRIPLEALC